MSFIVQHNPDLRLQAFLEFMAGQGQRRQQVNDQEALWRYQQNQQLGQGLGQGVGNFLNVFAQDSTANRAAARELQSGLALQHDQQAGMASLENLRTTNDRLQAADAAMLQAYGLGGRSGQRGQQPMMFGPGAMPMQAPQLGDMTDPGLSQQFPQQPQPPPERPRPTDPMYLPEYKKLTGEQAQIEHDLTQLEARHAPPEEMLTAKMAATRRLLTIVPRIKQLQAPDNTPMYPGGPKGEPMRMGPGFNVGEDGSTYAYDEKGTPHKWLPAKDAKQVRGGYIGANGQQVPFEANSLYDLPDGRTVTTNKNGEPSYHKAEDGEKEDKRVVRAMAEVDANARANAIDASRPVSNPTDIVTVLTQNKEAEQRAWLVEYSPRTITMAEYQKLGRRILSKWGNDPEMVPRDLAREVKNLGWKLRGESEPWYQSSGMDRP